MGVFWKLCVLATFCLSCQGLDGNSTEFTEDKKAFKVELFPSNPAYAGQTRMPRMFFGKIHSGASFLTGLKLGSLLSKKGFELGHGKISSVHSFQMFGKNVNSAMSLSYGDENSLLPIFDDEPDNGSLKKSSLKNEEKKVFRVTVIEDPVSEVTVNETQDETLDSEGEKKKQDILVLYQDSDEENKNKDFLAEHNKRVKDFNDSIIRRTNSKF